MKKIFNKSLVALMALLTTVGCNQSETSSSQSSSSNSNTSGVITSSSSNTDSGEKRQLENMLTELRKGVKLVGTINQEVSYLDGDHGLPTGEKATNTYNAEYTYQSEGEVGFASYVTNVSADGLENVWANNKVFKGEDGYAYYYKLNYDNTVVKVPFMDSGSPVNFGYYCLNPFTYLKAEDFIEVKNKENTYTLTSSKATLIASNILGDVDEAFYGLIDTFEFYIEDGMFSSFTIVPKGIYDTNIDLNIGAMIYYYLKQSATFELKDIGVATIEKPTVKEVTSYPEEIAKLQSAFDNFDSKNFTANLKIQHSAENGGQVENATYYYTGEHLYYTTQEISNTPANSDLLLYDDGDEYLVPFAYSYEDSVDRIVFTEDAVPSYNRYNNFTYDSVLPIIKGVSANLFEYNKTFKNYNICEERVADFAASAIVPPISPISFYLDGNGDTFKVKLTSSGEIDYISFSYFYSSFLGVYAASARLTFTDIGTTTLPYDLTVA